MMDPHEIILWQRSPLDTFAKRVPRWLFEVYRAASREVAWRLRHAEAVPVPFDEGARRERARHIREAQRHARTLDVALDLAIAMCRRGA